MSLGTRVAAKRTEKGWSQRKLGRMAGVPHTLIAALENGSRSDIRTETAKKIARALGVGVDYLIGTWDDDNTMDSSKSD